MLEIVHPIKEIAEEEPFDLQMICPVKDQVLTKYRCDREKGLKTLERSIETDEAEECADSGQGYQ